MRESSITWTNPGQGLMLVADCSKILEGLTIKISKMENSYFYRIEMGSQVIDQQHMPESVGVQGCKLEALRLTALYLKKSSDRMYQEVGSVYGEDHAFSRVLARIFG